MIKKKRLPFGTVIVILAAVLILACILSTTLGRYPISVWELGGIAWNQVMKLVEQFGRWLGVDMPELRLEPFWTATQEALFLKHRVPRIAIACMVGCSLSTAGACYQGVFQNPMAAPDILGASSGAALGASLAIIMGYTNAVIGGMAFVFSLATVTLVILVGNHARGNRVVGLILSGVMISSLVSSGTSFIKLIADTEEQLPAITYWLMGSFNGAKLEDILFAAIPMAIGLIPVFILRWRINILSLGDDEAQTLGINAKRLRIIIIICSALITAASVAVSGIIGWVGLVIPHMARRVVGNDYKKLIPATMLFGAIFMLLVDNICRNVWATDLPIGILTSFVGAPFFIYLIMKEGDQL
nr:iron ABC transporter permease [uncultured Flavonifractor sp.]